MAMIEASGLSRSFGDKQAVTDVSLQVGPGEIVGLLGANGAGKTTLLRMLVGMLQPSVGAARIGGLDPQIEVAQARSLIGYVTGDTALPPRLTPREVMELFCGLHQLPASGIASRIDEVADLLALRPFLNQHCATLSTGQRQRANLARALLHAPKALILDEPTATLDPLAARAVMDVLRSAKQSGTAVLLSTHAMAEAELVCDRVLLVHAGRLLAAGTVEQVCAAAGGRTLTEAFLTLVQASEGGAR